MSGSVRPLAAALRNPAAAWRKVNSITKAAAATSGALALLLGGYGTFAYWSAHSSSGSAGGFSAGGMSPSPAGSCVPWTLTAVSNPVYNGATVGMTAPQVPMVPGDTATSVCTTTVSVVGDHLYVAAAVVNPVWATVSAIETAGTSALNVTVTSLQINGVGYSAAASPGTAYDPTVPIKLPTGTYTVKAYVTAHWDYGTVSSPAPTLAASNVSQNGTAQLAAIQVTLTQLDPSTTTPSATAVP
jgi:alternate signal-mediated exported protein